MTKHYLIVGAGFSGAVLARELAERTGKHVTVIDERAHLAGNCHTRRDSVSGVMLHQYGPHIFHTNSGRVWEYANRHAKFYPFVNRVKAVTKRGVFTLPVNLLTINQFFNKTFRPDEAREFLTTLGDASISEPQNFEEQALKFIGRELYETFFHGYTKKQWGCEPRELPASVLKRLPVRFSYDDNYYADRHQGIPEEGYTAIVEKILAHPNISVRLHTAFAHEMIGHYAHTFYSGTIDGFFNHQLGRLGYRTMIFERVDADGDYQGNAVLNYPDTAVPYTRIHEHKHFAPWEEHAKTVAFREYSKETADGDAPFYPKNLPADRQRYQEYLQLAAHRKDVTFIGRLGTYRYLDMDTTIAAALTLADEYCRRR
ncbi:MAG: UDP-galactopyranose mutase [Verrucomicrobiales bacterium]|jgi:UDP-galactopyranose mutase|nr:UDP-galactopyranose mutase [Verrucomicrobiales bacterium]